MISPGITLTALTLLVGTLAPTLASAQGGGDAHAPAAEVDSLAELSSAQPSESDVEAERMLDAVAADPRATGSLPEAMQDSPESQAAPAEPKTPQEWFFTVQPYLWTAGIDGDIGVDSSQEIPFDVSFSDILEDLQWAFMFSFDARYDPSGWGFFVDSIYMDLHQTENQIDVDLSLRMLEADATWRPNRAVPFDVLVGARLWHGTIDLDFPVLGDFDGDQTWVDPIVGARGTWQIDEHWGLYGRADIGGFGVGSEFTWQALGYVSYTFNDTWSAQMGYRYLSIDYDQDDFLLDVDMSGPLLGVQTS